MFLITMFASKSVGAVLHISDNWRPESLVDVFVKYTMLPCYFQTRQHMQKVIKPGMTMIEIV